MSEQTIRFQLQPRAAAIVQRAAQALNLRVLKQTHVCDPRGQEILVVVLRDALDAYRLAERTAGDPGWAREFL